MKLEPGKTYKAKGANIPTVTIISEFKPYDSYASFFGVATSTPEYLGRVGTSWTDTWNADGTLKHTKGYMDGSENNDDYTLVEEVQDAKQGE